ncbi:MAG: hypothetical protein DHS20C15_23180 [Planctomycetota bacterium]|nr:MAG: hypothetical protein DHS20C15_23180 [Planctomycetota bacterium]
MIDLDAFVRRLRFLLERWVQRGLVSQLLFIAALIAGVAALGGLAAWALTESFATLPEAIWWSFLRLTDPGYLGDDQGTTLRVISTVVTVAGYVLFMGSLIAIMTQWLALTLRKLESGLTPIAMQNHFVILGWTNRTPETVKKLLGAGGRLQRFLHERNVGRLRVVVLADEVDAARRLELREHLGEFWSESQIFVRSGSSLNHDDLERLDILRAAVVMVPGADFELGGAELSDTRVVKTLLNLDSLLRHAPPDSGPQVVAEMFDPHKVSIARDAVRTSTEVIASDRLISRLLSQSLRHPGIARVLLKLLTHGQGNAVYLRRFPELEGAPLSSLLERFPLAIVLGVVRDPDGTAVVHLDPTHDVQLARDDMLILVAESHHHCVPQDVPPEVAAAAESLPEISAPSATGEHASKRTDTPRARRRLLVLGWGHKLPTLLSELQESAGERFHVTLLTRQDIGERERMLAHLNVDDSALHIEHVQGDYSIERDLRSVNPASHDHVLFVASNWMESSEEADARSVLGLLLLRSLLRGAPEPPEVLVEFLDPDNERILGDGGELVFVSPRILSHLLAHVSLRPELNLVYDELICAGGSELELRTPGELGLLSETVSFRDLQHAARREQCVALGVLQARDDEPAELLLNPARDRELSMGRRDRVIVLAAVD